MYYKVWRYMLHKSMKTMQTVNSIKLCESVIRNNDIEPANKHKIITISLLPKENFIM